MRERELEGNEEAMTEAKYRENWKQMRILRR